MIKTLDLNIWDRDFTLEIIFDCYSDEVVTKEQEDALSTFISHQEWIAKAKADVIKYCEKDIISDEKSNKKDSIFSYIKPNYVFVKRARNPKVALMCEYKYDPEHGLAIIFSYDGKVTVGVQDIII